MAWRFKVSKYKNAAPKFPKREETLLEVPIGTLMHSCGNHIAASCNFMAFNSESGGGGNLGVLPLETTGRVGQSLPILKAHSDFVTDMMFSPFDDQLLATCSSDCTVKVWSLPETERLSENINTLSPLVTLGDQERRVENVLWNPVADGVLAASTHTSLKVFDLETAAQKYDISSHGDQIQGICWNGGGSLMATTCKDKKLRTLDPRTSSVAQECFGHQTNRDSRVVWLGNTDFIITTGVSMSRSREFKIWDSRKLGSALKTEDKGTSTGTLMPLLDVDTNMLLLVGKGDTSWTYLEASESDPYLTTNAMERTERSEQIKGACLVPKRAVHVMDGEVDRMLLITNNCIVPLPYIVPRKQYKDFHSDLFPDTRSMEPGLAASQWFCGENGEVPLMSLDPAKRGAQEKTKKKDREQVASKTDKQISEPTVEKKPVEVEKSSSAAAGSKSASHTPSTQVQAPARVVKEPAPLVQEPTPVVIPEPSKAAKIFGAIHQSKCKHVQGVTQHLSKHIVNIRRLCRTLPGHCNIFCANTKRCVVPIEGSGGLVAVIELDKPGRLPDTGVPVIQNGSNVNDFVFDPFNDNRLLVGCENAKVYIWTIPDGGLTETLTECDSYLMSHTEKIYFVRFHPLARDVVMTAAYDMTLKIWDLSDNTEQIEISCHTDEIFCAEWSQDGKFIATVCKDGRIRIFDPRKSTEPVKVGEGPKGGRGARVVWAVNMKYLVISGFSSSSVRILSVYSVEKLGSALHTIELEVSPSILIPHYDEGTSTVFLTGRGDTTILAFEVSDDSPHLYALSSTKPEGLHQGLAMMPKTACDVKKAEIARMWRLTQTTIEPISFTVPRVKLEYFQDDLYPDTMQSGVPAMTSQEWFKGVDRAPVTVALRPAGMKLLSEAPVEAPKPKKYDSYSAETYKTDEMKKEELISAMTNKLDKNEQPLPQDSAEGVDSDEWDDY